LQHIIGWENWFKGRITSTWGILYTHDLETTNHGLRNQTPVKWAKKVIELTWGFVLCNWTIHIDLEHHFIPPTEISKLWAISIKLQYNWFFYMPVKRGNYQYKQQNYGRAFIKR
jgi:hypothetical protein